MTALPFLDLKQEAEAEQGSEDSPAKLSRTLKTRAVYYLSKRDYSRSELAKKLAAPSFLEKKNAVLNHTDLPKPPTVEIIAQVLDDLYKQGFLNDERFANSVVKRQSSKHGTARVIASLSQHQLEHQLVAELTQQLKDSELSRCYTVWFKRFAYNIFEGSENSESSENSKNLSYQDKQSILGKQGRFLMQRGFSADAVRKVLNGWQPDI